MWRSNTDTLQVWTRVMVEVESMATQGHISRPGAWSFPDCLELGVAGQETLTWEESKSNLALFAVTSSPLIMGNDPRQGRMQPRLVELLSNRDMLEVDQLYDDDAQFAGGRLASWPPGRELWAKPLPDKRAAVVLFNRAGDVIGETPEGADPKPAHCTDPHSTMPPCRGCYVNDDRPWLAPCDDNATASTGAQTIALPQAALPRAWLVGRAATGPSSATCTTSSRRRAAARPSAASPTGARSCRRTARGSSACPTAARCGAERSRVADSLLVGRHAGYVCWDAGYSSPQGRNSHGGYVGPL